jgi:hypothetical protein
MTKITPIENRRYPFDRFILRPLSPWCLHGLDGGIVRRPLKGVEVRHLPAIALLLALACGTREERAARDTSAASAETATVAPIVSGQEIYIDAVTSTNPLIVKGRARTFENTVQVRARDARDSVLTEVFETSVGEMGHHNPFVAQAWLVRDPGSHVTVEAFEYSAMDGSVRSLTSKRVAIPAARTKLTLMFATDDCARTAPFTRDVPPTVSVARLLVEMLVAGPDDTEKAAGASAPFPRGSRVKSVVLRDGELTVDFNESLQNVGGSCAAQAIRESVTQTLSRLPAVKRVVITAAGSRELALQP